VTDVAAVCASELEHEAFVYSSDDEYVSTLAPLIEAAVNAGDEVIVVVPTANERLLRAALTVAAHRVSWIDAAEWYRHPARTISAYDRALRELRPGCAAFVIGEVQFGTTETEWAEWTRYESVLNRVLERYPARVICPYDARALAPAVVADASRTHPTLVGIDARRPSVAFVEPEVFVTPLPPARSNGDVFEATIVGARSVRDGRRLFTEVARDVGFADERVDELAVAVSEVLTNAVVHGGGRATMRVSAERHEVLCVVADEGAGADDPLLGFRAPNGMSEGGYGLWFARQTFDRVEIERSAAGGLVVHLVAVC